MSVIITSPVGRLVSGSVSQMSLLKDNKTGVPRLDAAGQQLRQSYFAVAVPKNPGEQHWNTTPWGRMCWDEGHRAHPAYADHPGFSWKIEDGDSQSPNKKGRKNCEREGFPGHWIIKFSSLYAPKVCDAKGTAEIDPATVKLGYYVQVNFSVRGNTGDSPGIYVSANVVALSGYGPEIVVGADIGDCGFGEGVQLPAGASATPVAGMAAAAPTPATPAAPAVPLLPNPAILGTEPRPPAALVRTLTEKAQGATYEALVGNGWTDALLIQHGLMLP